MELPIDYASEAARRAAFSYAARIGVAPAAGSRPISWYQIHMCHALDVMEREARKITELPTGPVKVRLFHGMLQAMTLGPNATRVWRTFGTPADVYRQADMLSRK